MHELSIARSIVEIACEKSQREGNARVETVYLKLGALSGVVPDALLFSWDLACEGTTIAGARLEIEPVPVEVQCPVCRWAATLAEPLDLVCASCGQAPVAVLRGAELEVSALDITD
jgi:hydrogenase nickel incorporation protein HypA/HybF